MNDAAIAPRRGWRRWKRWLIGLALVVIAIVILVGVLTVVIAAPADRPAPTENHATAPVTAPALAERLTLLSINLAHGRSDGASQLTTSTAITRINLGKVADLIVREQADLVCVQEADSPSWWSGGFDHLALVATGADLPWVVRSSHVDGFGLHYGTGIIGRWSLADGRAHTFRPTPPTFAKGFTVAAVTWPGVAEPFDLVSLHTDFASAAARREQIDELIAVLRARGRDCIVGGDFNSGWHEGGAVRQLADAFGLETAEPEADLVTFPATGGRLDWILVSPAFRIAEHAVLTDVVSDHRVVRAVVERR